MDLLFDRLKGALVEPFAWFIAHVDNKKEVGKRRKNGKSLSDQSLKRARVWKGFEIFHENKTRRNRREGLEITKHENKTQMRSNTEQSGMIQRMELHGGHTLLRGHRGHSLHGRHSLRHALGHGRHSLRHRRHSLRHSLRHALLRRHGGHALRHRRHTLRHGRHARHRGHH